MYERGCALDGCTYLLKRREEEDLRAITTYPTRTASSLFCCYHDIYVLEGQVSRTFEGCSHCLIDQRHDPAPMMGFELVITDDILTGLDIVFASSNDGKEVYDYSKGGR